MLSRSGRRGCGAPHAPASRPRSCRTAGAIGPRRASPTASPTRSFALVLVASLLGGSPNGCRQGRSLGWNMGPDISVTLPEANLSPVRGPPEAGVGLPVRACGADRTTRTAKTLTDLSRGCCGRSSPLSARTPFAYPTASSRSVMRAPSTPRNRLSRNAFKARRSSARCRSAGIREAPAGGRARFRRIRNVVGMEYGDSAPRLALNEERLGRR